MTRQTTLTDSNDSNLDDSYTSKLKFAREYYLTNKEGSTSVLDCHGLSDDLINQLYDDFSCFKNTNNYLVLRQKNGFHKGKQFALKLSKRGNSVYRNEKRNRIFSLLDGLRDSDYDLNFTDKDFTSALMVTFSYDTKRCSLKTAWENIAGEYNQAVTSLRQKFGEVSAFRIFEGYENGYPHIHAIFLFHNRKFSTFRKNGKVRIDDKEVVQDSLNWHSFVDIEGVQHIGKSINYLAKYFVKDSLKVSDNPTDVKKAKVTLALNWLFMKRSFAISGDFKKVLNDLIHSLSNSNKSLDFTQLNQLFRWLEKVDFEFVTTFSSDLLDFDESETFIQLSSEEIAKIDLT